MELEWKAGVLDEVPRSRKLLRNRCELVVIASVVIEFDEADEFNFDALVL